MAAPSLSGWVVKRSVSSTYLKNWKRRYLRLTRGELQWSERADGPPAGSLRLRPDSAVTVSEALNESSTHLDSSGERVAVRVEVGSQTLLFRPEEPSANDWRVAIIEAIGVAKREAMRQLQRDQSERQVAADQLLNPLAALSTLDDKLAEALERGDIRLLRVEWLLAQPDDFRMQRRQDLEMLEQQGGLSPLLSPKEAVALLRNGRREIGALTYGWILLWDPDPTGARMVLLRRVLKQRKYIKALFWDQATLYQPPRTDEQDVAFGRALGVMMDLYASANGTTVLQIKEIPARPAEYDGLLCLGEVPEGLSEADLIARLQQFGEIESCTAPVHRQGVMQHRVKFRAHGAAQQAKVEAPKLELCKWASIAYDDFRAYEDRGW